MLLAPSHQLLPRKSRVGAQDDLNLRPAAADLRHDALDLGHRAGGGVTIRTAQKGTQQVWTAENVEWEIAVSPVVAMKEATLLLAMQRIVGRIQIQNDLGGYRLMSRQERLDQEAVHGLGIHRDLPIPILLDSTPLQAVQSTLAGQRLAPVLLLTAVVAGGICLAHHGRQQRIRSQLLVVVQVLVGQSQAEDTLTDQLLNTVLHIGRVALIPKAGRKLSQNPATPLDLRQQQQTAVRGQSPPVKGGHRGPPPHTLKFQLRRITVCRHRAVLLVRYKCCRHNTYTTGNSPFPYLR